MSPSKNLLLVVTGSVAAFKAAALASKLTQAGYAVRTVLTDSALQFVGRMQFEGLTQEKVYTSIFDPGEAHSHLTLSQWASLTLVYPATANLLAKWSVGLADDLASAVFVGNEGPTWIYPAMNPRMWSHPSVQKSVTTLREWGVQVVDPAEGRMACGDTGEGRLPEPEAILEQVRNFFQTTAQTSPSHSSVLVTAGGSREPIDSVRSITNFSTGETGIRIAERLQADGVPVILLKAKSARTPRIKGIRVVEFDTFTDFHERFRDLLSTGEVESLVHAAALSDFQIAVPNEGKLRGEDSVSLELKPTPKLVQVAREYSRGKLKKLISFKLTAGHHEFNPEKYSESDFIVQNELSQVQGEKHSTQVFSKSAAGDWRKMGKFSTKTELCEWIASVL